MIYELCPTINKEFLTEAILERLKADPEVYEALARLIYGLEHSDAESHESLVWETYTDRLAYLISRAKAGL